MSVSVTPRTRSAAVRVIAAIAVALAFMLGAYVLLDAARPDTGLISFSFLLVLPAAVCGFVAYVADPWKERTHRSYMAVPFWLLAVVVVVSLVFLREGVICVLLLSPLWLISGAVGAEITYRLRRRTDDGRTYCLTLLALPLLAMQIEPMMPLPLDTAIVTRSIVVHATPDTLWPLLEGIPDVKPGEGRWNVSQDLIGIPRPIGARLIGQGIGADRHADWGDRIHFRERITDWRPGRALGWRFIFDDIAGWGFTDRHLMPDSPYFRVTVGGYRLEPVAQGTTRVILDTQYRITTPVWGQLFLGDLENNLLALVKGRAERPDQRLAPASSPAIPRRHDT